MFRQPGADFLAGGFDGADGALVKAKRNASMIHRLAALLRTHDSTLRGARLCRGCAYRTTVTRRDSSPNGERSFTK